MSSLFVELAENDECVIVDCSSLSFDGGSLICFRDENMQQVVAAFSPCGWSTCSWSDPREVSA
ncbi:hypothetical protein FRC0095_01489 [Corynebacterium diphtheriae]|nr:hypothetical protein CIP107524_01483 [Corynebacterium diphtheriae]CAB0654562.1 hypothetical protein CIP107567_01514 [Corynebacterium diphtheriae]CAB0727299.1 hypothetical protein FRC0087_01391 [Corynebacterium diphtheriae]CAB0737513.1 hypothetical protein FRC0095_01489 [Corynebacterium diphtheriae]CAB0744432.1 hypothetical protein FRC0137_00822 [Corynebacterium diphtheriae]